MMPKKVELVVPWHICPVNAPDVFSPPEDLSHKPLHCRQRCSPQFPLVHGSIHHFPWVQHFGVQGERDQGVEKAPAVGMHGVLKVSEMGQAVFEKNLQVSSSFVAVEGPAKIV